MLFQGMWLYAQGPCSFDDIGWTLLRFALSWLLAVRSDFMLIQTQWLALVICALSSILARRSVDLLILRVWLAL